MPTQSLCLENINARYDYVKSLPIMEYKNANPKIVIGIDNCFVGISKRSSHGQFGEPICIQTKICNILYGPINCGRPLVQRNVLFKANG